jgi:Reverse transcriptase (RNA-dependent DNA polymerase)
MLAYGPNEKELDRVYEILSKQFKTKDLGAPVHFLGIKVTREQNEITLSQHAYLAKIIERFDRSNGTKVRQRSKPYEAILPKSVALIGRLLQQDPIYTMQPQYSRDSHRTLALSITITACEMVTFRRLLIKWLEGATTIKIKHQHAGRRLLTK